MYIRPWSFKFWLSEIWFKCRIRKRFWIFMYGWKGNCGHYCRVHLVRDPENNTRELMFIPEAGCPVHDPED